MSRGVERMRRPDVVLFLLFLDIPARSFRLLHNLVLELLRHGVVVVHFHGEAAAALGHGG
jgi:hypothetical protein